jgi:hypothetical protein
MNEPRKGRSRYDIALNKPIRDCTTCEEYGAACEHPASDLGGCEKFVEPI